MHVTYSSHGLKVGRSLILEVVGVLDLARSPGSLVGGVVHEGSSPLALEVGVRLHGLGPGSAASCLGALGVGHRGGDPVAVLLIIPILGLLGLGVSDGQGLALEPALGLDSLLVKDLEGRILVPVLGLLGLGVGDAGLVDPVIGLGVLGVVNLLGGVHRRGKVLKEGASPDLIPILVDGVGVVGVDDEGVELRRLDNLGARRGPQVLLLILASLGVLVVEDKVDLVGVTALVGTEHDDVGGRVGELVLVEGLVIAEELHVGATALEPVCEVTGQHD